MDKIAQLTVSPENRKEHLVKVFLAQPPAEAEKLLGRLFCLFEFVDQRQELIQLLNWLTATCQKVYYSYEDLALEQTGWQTVEEIFEKTVEAVNQLLNQWLKEQKIKLPLLGTALTWGVVHQGRLYYTNLGHNKALLIYQSSKKNNRALQPSLAGEYQLLNVSKKTSDLNEGLVSQEKLFSSVIAGAVPASGYFLFCNEALYEYFSEKQLIKIITTLPPASALEQLRNIVQQTTVYVPFTAVLIKHGRPAIAAAENLVQTQTLRAKQTAPLSIGSTADAPSLRLTVEVTPQLNNTEDATDRILSPSGLLPKNLGRLFSWLKKPGSVFSQKTYRLKEHLVFRRRPIWPRLLPVLKLIITTAALTFWKILQLLVSPRHLRQTGQNFWLKSKKLTLKHWLMLGAGAICLLLLAANLFYSHWQKQRLAEQKLFTETKNILEQVQLQSSAGLLFSNAAQARGQLTQARASLEQLPQKTVEQKQSYQELQNLYQALYDRINQITRLQNLTPLAKLSGSPDNLIAQNKRLYLAGNDGLTIIDPQTSAAPVVVNNDLIKNLSQPNLDSSGLIYYLQNNNSLVRFNPADNSLQALPTDNLPDNISSLLVYNDRFYLFDAGQKQLSRYQRIGSSLGQMRPWLTSDQGLSKVISLSADGFIYLIADQTVTKYGAGNRQEFSLETFYPALAKPDKIIVLFDLDLLYISDKTNARIVVFDKNGKFLKQYAGEQLTNLVDIAADEAAGQLYILTNDAVYAIPLEKPE